jgi:hypothetical protein
MMEILKEKLSAAMSILADSEDLVEIQ